MKRVLTSLLLVLSTVVVLRAQTVVDIIVNSPDHTILETAVLTAGLETTLATAGPFTVFAPTDSAFNALPGTLLQDLLANPAALRNILLYHVLDGNFPSSDIPMGQNYFNSLFDDFSMMVINDNGVQVNQAFVNAANLTATNGVVHSVDAVLLPLTLGQVVGLSPAHSTLETAINASGFANAFASTTSGPFTLFAPTDAAFDLLPAGTVAALLGDQGALQTYLLYHVIGLDRPSPLLPELSWLPTANNGYSLQLINDATGLFANDAQVVFRDIKTFNGTVHVIDKTLSIPTIADWVTTSPIHSTLEAGVGITGLGGALSDPDAQLTVFAPDNDAFDAVDPMVLNALLADSTALTEVILYHALGDSLSSPRIPADLSFSQTLSGYTAQIENDGSTIILDANSEVFLGNQLTLNGYVHSIDNVLIPPTVADIAVRSPVHTTLETAVGLANLVGALSDPTANLTVFAPTDDAFDAVDPAVLAALLADPTDSLTNVLLYHVLGAQVSASDIVDNNITTATTLQGEDISIDVTANGVVLNSDVNVVITDIFGTNGVVHVIDGVLIPQVLSSTGAEPASSAGIVVAPIPADTYTDLRLPSNMTREVTVDLYDSRGAQLDQIRVNGGTTRIDLSSRAAGIYYMLIADGDKRYYQPLVVK